MITDVEKGKGKREKGEKGKRKKEKRQISKGKGVKHVYLVCANNSLNCRAINL
jgi:hypothetical protein